MSLNLLKLLNTSNYRQYNVCIAKYLGSVNAAIMLHDIVDQFEYYKEKNGLIRYNKHNGEWFYYTVEKCTERTCLSEKEQKSALKVLEKLNIVIHKNIGLPAKRHFKINEGRLLELFTNSKKDSSSAKRAELDSTKGRNYNSQKGGANKEPYKEPNKEPDKNIYSRKSKISDDTQDFEEKELSHQEKKDSQSFKSALVLADIMKQYILRWKKKLSKKHDPQKWAVDIEKLIRIDGYSGEDISDVLYWISIQEENKNGFSWRNQILSGRSLRKHFEELHASYMNSFSKNEEAEL